MRTDKKTNRLVMAAVFLALGLVMPFLTAQIPEVGSKLLPMHIPVLICGFVCGWQYGLLVGFVLPILRSMIFGMPPLFPTAAAMAFELAAYGAFSGILYEKLPRSTGSVYGALIGAMLAGRIVWGVVSMPMNGIAGKAYSWQVFMAGAFLNAVPGIVLQIILIPVVIFALERARVMEMLAE